MTLPLTLEARQRRARFRANHRGMKEMDIVLGRYADAQVDAMDEATLAEFEVLLELYDRDLFKWFMGEAPVPVDAETDLFRAICAFHAIKLT